MEQVEDGDGDGDGDREFPLRRGNSLELLVNGDEIFPAMLDAVRAARSTISFETYVYWRGGIAREFAEALAARARDGVSVRVVLDWFGTKEMDPNLVDLMESAGVAVHHHRPLRWFQLDRSNHRSHRKLLIVDGRIGFIGGVGIADEWTGNAEDHHHWRDNHYRVTGPVVRDMQELFFTHWVLDPPPGDDSEEIYPELEPTGDIAVKLIASEPIKGPDRIEDAFIGMMNRARERFAVISPYFAPDERALEALVEAAGRGVRIEVVTAGKYNDMKIVRKASRVDWGRLFRAGVKIYEYNRTLIHVKLAVVDSEITFVGSANFDVRSLRLNDEASLWIEDESVARNHLEWFEKDREAAREVTEGEWANRPLTDKALDHMSWLFKPWL